MSTARHVPETWHLDDDGPWTVAREAGLRQVAVSSFVRLRAADGTSHARSMAWLITLVAIQGLIALVGLLSTIGGDAAIGRAADRVIETAAPGPVGSALSTAIDQARMVGASGRFVAMLLGVFGALVTGTTAMGELQRTLNRLYGIERDRPMLEKYRLAFLHALTAGVLLAIAFTAVAVGDSVGDALEDNALDTVWHIARLPLGLLLVMAAMSLLLRRCPRRQQPAWSWLAPGAGVAVALWAIFTVALGVLFAYTSSFGDVYGPLAGMVALLLWALLSSFGIFYGVAVAAELEHCRSTQASERWRDRPPSDQSSPGSGDLPPVRATRLSNPLSQ